MKQLVVVIGRGHSGTRAIARTLRESGIFIGSKLNGSEDRIHEGVMYEAARLPGPRVVHVGGSRWDFVELVEGPIPDGFRGLMDRYVKELLDHKGPAGWKLPETTLVYPWLVRLYPGFKYVHWWRHPRDVVLKSHGTDELGEWGIPWARPGEAVTRRALSWAYQFQIVRETPRPEHFLELQLEEFVRNQSKVLKQLGKFVGRDLPAIPVRKEVLQRWKHDPGWQRAKGVLHDIEHRHGL